MLRLLVLLLLVANTGYFAWGSGMLRAYGLGPTPQQEPQRLQQQVRPDALRVLSHSELQRVEEQLKADQAPRECLQAGPLDAATATAVRKLLEAQLPASAWQLETTRTSARWLVYVGKFPNADALAKKKAELIALGVKPEAVRNPALEPGLSLGAADTRKDAEALLARLAPKGIRTARVVQEREESQAATLKLPAISESTRAQLGDLKTALGSRTLLPCN